MLAAPRVRLRIMVADQAFDSIRPSFAEKFKPAEVKAVIGKVLAEKLADKSYNSELTAQWTREIADEIKNKLKTEMELPRYKFVVQAVVGEQRGEGVRMGCRCFWDADTDAYAEESYRNETLFCSATVFGIYLY